MWGEALGDDHLAAIGVARKVERQRDLARKVEEKHARAAERKRALEDERLRKIRQHLQRIEEACAAHRQLLAIRRRLLASEREAAAHLERCRPPPVMIPSDAAAGSLLCSPLIVYTPRHDAPSPDNDDDDEQSPGLGYTPDDESGNLSPRPWKAPVPLPRDPVLPKMVNFVQLRTPWRRRPQRRAQTPMRRARPPPMTCELEAVRTPYELPCELFEC